MIFLLGLGCTEERLIDIILHNGHIRVDEQTVVTSMAIDDGHIIALGDDTISYTPKKEEDLNGAILLPGFHDAHTHLLAGSFVMERLLLVGVSSMGNLSQKVQNYAQENPQEPWIIGFGWVYSQFEDPSGVALDDIVSDRPIALFDSSGHNLLVNSIAMEYAGITAQSIAPVGGEIVHDAQGNPTGLLKESAIELISPLMLEAYNDEAFVAPLQKELENFSELGISGISEILAVPGVSLAKPQLYSELYDRGELPLRVHYYLPVFALNELSSIIEHSLEYERSRVRFAGIKVWVDGSTSSGSSWSIEPAQNDSENFGSHYWSEEDLGTLVASAEEHQFSIKFHANGDAAIQAVLNAIESYAGIRAQSYIIEHAVLFDPEDYARAHDLGVCIGVQSGIASLGRFSDQSDIWGEERMQEAWRFDKLEESNIQTLLGTDWPVWPTVDPLVNAWTATQGLGDRGFSKENTLKSYTSNIGTCLNIQEGCLDIGCRADYSIFSQDPYDTPAEEWTNLTIIQTVLHD